MPVPTRTLHHAGAGAGAANLTPRPSHVAPARSRPRPEITRGRPKNRYNGSQAATPAMAAGSSIESAADLMLVLLYAPGSSMSPCEDVSDTTRLVKLLYLLVNEGGFGRLADDLRFVAKDFGPWSADVFDAIEMLKGMRLVNVERMRPHSLDEVVDDIERGYEDAGPAQRPERQKATYYLTSRGKRVARTLYEGATRSERERVEFVKRRFNKVSLDILLRYVRESYPARTAKPMIRRRVLK